jgi:hypothetical protein
MASYKKCVEDFCRGCGYDPKAAGTWREQIQTCSVKTCALWAVRPVSVQEQRKRRDAELDIDALVAALPDEEAV